MITPVPFLLADAGFTFEDVVRQYVEFVGTFFIVGAAAFYFLLLRPALRDHAAAMGAAGRAAARVGVAGALLRVLAIWMAASAQMADKHLSLIQALTSKPSDIAEAVATLIALIAFALAARATDDGLGTWIVAGAATLIAALGGLITNKLDAMVNPVHVFAASMWIGTLFVLIVAGISTALGGALAPEERGPTVAVLVNRFSTIALWSAGVLVLSGVTTAYLHLGEVSALWTSSYGQTLIVKLCIVAGVFALGAYNNQRMKPTLGTDEAGRRLMRSARLEIALAAVVLAVTAVLVNLPAPAEHVH